MVETLKSKIMDAFNRWIEEMNQSDDGTTVININVEFERIFSRNIIHIAFGEDISDEKFEILVPDNKEYTSMSPKVVSIREALHVTTELSS